MSFIYNNRKEDFPEFRIPSGCAVFGIIDESGKRFSGGAAIEGISVMHDRSNGLGGGFAAYGIYPQFENDRVFHIIYDDVEAKRQTEDEIQKSFKVFLSEEIPTRKTAGIQRPPLTYRYFLEPKDDSIFYREEDRGSDGIDGDNDLEKEDEIVNFVMEVNGNIKGAYIVSSGKNMGIFKGVGYPEDIGNFFKLDEYKGYLWTSHGRFPTNSAGWWGGAHPFGLLDWSVVHNGEISSYGTNKRFVSSFGYRCTLSTDTEVITYLFDFIVRRQRVDIRLIHWILSSPLWEEIDRKPHEKREVLKALRILYGGALLNGPFSIIVGNGSYMYALNDRIKLRPLVAARKDSYLFVSSEEASIRKVCPSPDVIWHPDGGVPLIGRIRKEGKRTSNGISSKVDNYREEKKRLEKQGSLIK